MAVETLLLGVDVGTTGAKAALFTTHGELRAVGQSEYKTNHPHTSWAEQDPEDWWKAVCQSIRQALDQVDGSSDRVAGIAVSSQAPTLLPLDKSGRPLRPALIWMDRRAEKEAIQLKESIGGTKVEQITGNRADPFYVAAKLLWFKTHEEDLHRKADLFVQANGFINYKLTGLHGLDHVHASLLQLRHWQSDQWSSELCDLCGVSPEQFPPIYPGHHVLGEITSTAAELTGLSAGTPVMAGTVDGAAAAVEAGVVEPGQAAEMTGTSTVLLLPNNQRLSMPIFIAMPHALPGLDLLLGAMATSGASLRWFRDQLGELEVETAARTEGNSYDILTQLAATSPPGSEKVLFLPYMMGERSPLWDSHARGVFFGLSLSTSKAALVRAILEGNAFALRHNVESAQQAGVTIKEIRSVGGGTQSPLWNQIKADVLGIPVLLPRTSVGAPFGNAILAGMGLGIYQDIRIALEEMVTIHNRYEPNPDNEELYQQLYQIFRNLYHHLKEDFDDLAAVI